MVKILVSGSIGGDFKEFSAKISALQISQHGPFDILICCGAFCSSSSEFNSIAPTLNLSLPTYVFDGDWRPQDCELPYNLNVLSRCGRIMIGDLSLVYLPFQGRSFYGAEYEKLVEETLVSSYRGCDLFISMDWPSGLHNGLSLSDIHALKNMNTDADIGGSGDVSLLACYLKPRYHFTSSKGFFFQRAPYANEPFRNNPAIATAPFTRFISLATVNALKDKVQKYIHALSLEPMGCASYREVTPAIYSQCPYGSIDPSAAVDLDPSNSLQGARDKRTRDLDDMYGEGAMAKKLAGSSAPLAGGQFFFGAKGKARPDSACPPAAPAPPTRVLFLGGLSPDTSDSDIRQSLKRFQVSDSDIVSVKMAGGKPYAFVELHDIRVAERVYGSCSANNSLFPGSETLVINGRSISVGYGKGQGSSSAPYPPHFSQGRGSGSNRSHSGTVLDAPPSDSAKTLFLGGLPPHTTVEEIRGIFSSISSSCISAVHVPEGKSFAFVEFDSQQSAVLAIQSSEVVHQDPTSGSEVRGYRLGGAVVGVGWAKGRSRDAEDASRPDSHSQDCWFCLASPSAKLHLVISVSDHIYVAIPRGGLAPLHCLLVPIACVPSRIHLSAAAKQNLRDYERRVEGLYASRHCACLVFERAIRTKSKDHMQVHMVPLPHGLVQQGQALQAFTATAALYNLKFQEILDERDADEVALSLPGGPYQEYFYVEIPLGDAVPPPPTPPHAPPPLCTAPMPPPMPPPALTRRRRFLYVHTAGEAPPEEYGSDRRGRPREYRFPMHFGVEVAAKALGEPEKANWKNCLQSEIVENNLAESFRSLFAPFDFAV